MAYLLEKRRSALLALRKKGVCPGPSSSFPQWRVSMVAMACPSSPKKERVYGLGHFPPPTAASCGGHHGRSSREEQVCPSSPKNEKSMTMDIFLFFPVESCGGDHGLLEKRRFAFTTPKKKRRMTIATFLFSSLESCDGV